MTFPIDAFMKQWRETRDKAAIPTRIPQSEYDLVMSAINGQFQPSPTAPTKEPAWLVEARALMGTREIVGPKHNSWIVKGWARLGAAWFNDDETPWCGLFVAHCINAAGLPYPAKGQFARALAWKDWGQACQPIVGAVAVFGRTGGGHVGFAVGESAGHIYVLGGNQSNAVNIMPIAKDRLVGFRWPSGVVMSTAKLPPMSGGTVSRNET